MSLIKKLFVLVAVCASGFVWVAAQSSSGAATALTGQDYGEIENLYARYNQGSDFRDAELFLSAFSEDATLVASNGNITQGMPAFRASREERLKGGLSGDSGMRHRTGSYLITPTPEGATGRAYYIVLDVKIKPAVMLFTGYYDDKFVRTADGWRIKHRTVNRDVAL
tara:strand:+ start:7671 stop:8171 length:501 start_codon:yes stop_codon:yes gene_type:complete